MKYVFQALSVLLFFYYVLNNLKTNVYEVLFMRRDPKVSVKDLMIRKLKKERMQD